MDIPALTGMLGPERNQTMENQDKELLIRLQMMSDYLIGLAPIIGIDWKTTLLEAKAEIVKSRAELEELRKKADIMYMATRWS